MSVSQGRGAEPADEQVITRAGDEGFDVDVCRLSGRTVVAVRGELDLATAPGLSRALVGLTSGDTDIEIDMRHLSFIDCSGITVLVLATRTLSDPGQVILRGPTPPVARVLSILALGDLIRIEP